MLLHWSKSIGSERVLGCKVFYGMGIAIVAFLFGYCGSYIGGKWRHRRRRWSGGNANRQLREMQLGCRCCSRCNAVYRHRRSRGSGNLRMPKLPLPSLLLLPPNLVPHFHQTPSKNIQPPPSTGIIHVAIGNIQRGTPHPIPQGAFGEKVVPGGQQPRTEGVPSPRLRDGDVPRDGTSMRIPEPLVEGRYGPSQPLGLSRRHDGCSSRRGRSHA